MLFIWCVYLFSDVFCGFTNLSTVSGTMLDVFLRIEECSFSGERSAALQFEVSGGLGDRWEGIKLLLGSVIKIMNSKTFTWSLFRCWQCSLSFCTSDVWCLLLIVVPFAHLETYHIIFTTIYDGKMMLHKVKLITSMDRNQILYSTVTPCVFVQIVMGWQEVCSYTYS